MIELTQPIIFTRKINDIWYLSRFGNWLSNLIWKDARPSHVLGMEIAFVACLVAVIVIGFIWLRKAK